MAATIRTFIAAPLPDAVSSEVGRFAAGMARRFPQYRWTSGHQLHLTINFLGDIRDRIIGELCELVARVAARHAPIDAALGGLGAFPKPARPRILWLGMELGSGPLAALHHDLADELQHLHIEPERKRYRPHLTLARLRDHQRWPDELVDELSGETTPTPRGRLEFTIDEIVVFSSYLDAAGAEHTPMARAALAAGRG